MILPTASNQHWGKEGRERTEQVVQKENGLSEVYTRARHGGACLSPSAWEQREGGEEFKAILRHTVSPTALSYTKPCLENKQKPK